MLSQHQIQTLEIPIPREFRGLAEHEAIANRPRHLPHWRQEGATYFVTFRLADSLPLQELKKWRTKWEALPSSSPEAEELRSARQSWEETTLDQALGCALLRDSSVRAPVAKVLHHFHQTRYHLGAWVIMPTHLHVLVRPFPNHDLNRIIGGWKQVSSREIPQAGRGFWSTENYDQIVRDDHHYRVTVRYIYQNPEKANLPAGHFERWIWTPSSS